MHRILRHSAEQEHAPMNFVENVPCLSPKCYMFKLFLCQQNKQQMLNNSAKSGNVYRLNNSITEISDHTTATQRVPLVWLCRMFSQ